MEPDKAEVSVSSCPSKEYLERRGQKARDLTQLTRLPRWLGIIIFTNATAVSNGFTEIMSGGKALKPCDHLAQVLGVQEILSQPNILFTRSSTGQSRGEGAKRTSRGEKFRVRMLSLS